MIKLIALMIMMTSVVDYRTEEADILAQEVVDAAYTNGLDPLLYAALLTEETHWNPRARSSVGAYGLPQLNPAFWPKNLFRTRWAQLYQGAVVLSTYKQKCGGDVRAVAAYRSGRCTAIGPATQKVFRTYRMWSGKVAGVEW